MQNFGIINNDFGVVFDEWGKCIKVQRTYTRGIYSMKKHIRIKGRIKTYLNFTIYLGILLCAVSVAVAMMDLMAGIFVSGFTLFYLVITLSLYYYNKPMIMNELISFATEYGQIQRRLLRELDIPYCLLDDAGKVMWTNSAFESMVHQPKGYNKSITSLTMADMDSIDSHVIERFMSYVSYYDKEDGATFSNGERGKLRKLSSLRAMFKYFFNKIK